LNEIYPSITLPNEKSYKRKSTISAESWVVGIPGSEFIKSVNPDPLQKARGEFTTRHLALPKTVCGRDRKGGDAGAGAA
jgi:hypothetical protein